MTIVVFWIKVHLSLFLYVKLTISQYWFGKCLGDQEAPSHSLNLWWQRPATPYSIIRPQCVDFHKSAAFNVYCAEPEISATNGTNVYFNNTTQKEVNIADSHALANIYIFVDPWWRHQRVTVSALLAIRAGNSPKWPVTRSFDVFLDLCLNKRLNK